MMRWFFAFGMLCVALSTMILVANEVYRSDLQQAKNQYVGNAKRETVADVQKFETSFESIYQNIRTLASLPSIHSIDRHGANLSEEGRITFQQVYNNLASSVDVSEVYILPIDFDPDKLDLLTQKNEEPILMFDSLIANAGMSTGSATQRDGAIATENIPEVEIFEYWQMRDQAKWLAKNYPTFDKISDLDFPLISGPEVVTCDNTDFITSRNDADRSGIILSVPFYGVDGRIRGMVSAVILTSALKKLMPTADYALVNKGYNYVAMAKGVEAMKASHDYIKAEKIDPNLIYSEVTPLSVINQQSPWTMWSGRPDSMFWNSDAVAVIEQAWWRNLYLILGLLAAVSALTYFVLSRMNLDQSLALNKALEDKRLYAENAAKDAQEHAQLLQELNADVTILNMRLTERAKELQLAQQEIVKRAKTAQLGSLIATVAHELRNPIGAIHTTCLALKQKLTTHDNDQQFTKQFALIDSGVMRCDKIIGQLLDYSRVQSLTKSATEIDTWLEKLLSSEGEKLPSFVTVECTLGLEGQIAQVDEGRLDRMILNLITNATEAMTENGKPHPEMGGRAPTIKVSTAQKIGGIEICVQDNGLGISPENLLKIREPLFTTKGFGMGLGIPTVEKIVELHGGNLDVASHLGRGTRVTIWLPIDHNVQNQEAA